MNKDNTENFKQLLMATKRTGIEAVLNWLEHATDFFTAPASTRFHGSYEGGLLEHSINTYNALKVLNETELTDKHLLKDTVAIIALLHDICKANTYKVVDRWRKDKNNKWEQYKTYEFNEDEPLGHGEKSIFILQRLGLQMTEQEVYMIRWHMGGFDESKLPLQSAMKKCPEIALIHAADLIATHIIESEVTDD